MDGNGVAPSESESERELSPLEALKVRLLEKQAGLEQVRRQMQILGVQEVALREVVSELEMAVALLEGRFTVRTKEPEVGSNRPEPVAEPGNQKTRAPKRDVRHDLLNWLRTKPEGATIEEMMAALGEPIRERSVKLAIDYWQSPPHVEIKTLDNRRYVASEHVQKAAPEPAPAPELLEREDQVAMGPAEIEAEWPKLRAVLRAFPEGATVGQITTRGIPSRLIDGAFHFNYVRRFEKDGWTYYALSDQDQDAAAAE